MRNDGIRLCRIVLLVLIFRPGAPLRAFEVNGKWPLPRLSFAINPNFPDESLAGTPEEQIEILLCAARTWEAQTRSGFEMIYVGETTVQHLAEDGTNALFWSRADGNGALAGTKVDFDLRTGEIRHFDIIFYARAFGVPLRWSGPDEPPPDTFDIGGIATHELGHALGLGHSDIRSATMYPAAVDRGLALRTLEDDDRAGVEFLYGTVSPTTQGVEVTRVDPESGPLVGGDEVFLQGVNFTYNSDTQLRVDGMIVDPSRWTVESCDLLRILSMPPHAAGTVDITVSNTVGTFTLNAAYVYGVAGPRVLSVVPPRGSLVGGILLTVTGERFGETAVIHVDGLPLEEQLVVDEETIIGFLPPGRRAGAVDVRLTQGVDSFVLTGGFFYEGDSEFLRGDANGDGDVNIADVSATLDFLFEGGIEPDCRKALDANDDGAINISDPTFVLGFLFASGDRIPPPYPRPGIDPTPDDLPCR